MSKSVYHSMRWIDTFYSSWKVAESPLYTQLQHTNVILSTSRTDLQNPTQSMWVQRSQSTKQIDLFSHTCEALDGVIKGKCGIAVRHCLGYAWWVSVTSGYYCVDIRKFYLPNPRREQKPTRTGITLNRSEWNKFKQLVQLAESHYPSVATALPYLDHPLHHDHHCPECNPFGAWYSQKWYWTDGDFSRRIRKSETVIEPLLIDTHRASYIIKLMCLCVRECVSNLINIWHESICVCWLLFLREQSVSIHIT